MKRIYEKPNVELLEADVQSFLLLSASGGSTTDESFVRQDVGSEWDDVWGED